MEENILTEGRVREPLTLWKDHGVLVDGHHRKRVLDEHPEIPFTIDEIEFADEDAVDEWIIKNQLGKHNLTEIQMTVLRGLLYKARKNANGGDRTSDSARKKSALKDEGFERTSQKVGTTSTRLPIVCPTNLYEVIPLIHRLPSMHRVGELAQGTSDATNSASEGGERHGKRARNI